MLCSGMHARLAAAFAQGQRGGGLFIIVSF